MKTTTFKQFLKEGDVVKLEIPSKKELKKILDWPITGSGEKDGELMQAIHDFVANKNNPNRARRMALKKLDDVMGVDNPTITDKDIEDYLDGAERNE